MKRILITGGPTNEIVDEVMKITNMSTGSLSLDLADQARSKGDFVTLIINNSVLNTARFSKYGFDKEDPNVKIVPVETTEDMYNALKAESESGLAYDVIIHASAVGDYKPEFTFRMEDMASKIAGAIAGSSFKDEKSLTEKILSVMTDPSCKVDNSSKISSYEPNLTVKLTLTTKLISNLRRWFPEALLIGCKLLENVTPDHLVEVATKLAVKNDMDYILANDLAQLRKGQLVRYLVTKDGFTGLRLNDEGFPPLLGYARENWF